MESKDKNDLSPIEIDTINNQRKFDRGYSNEERLKLKISQRDWDTIALLPEEIAMIKKFRDNNYNNKNFNSKDLLDQINKTISDNNDRIDTQIRTNTQQIKNYETKIENINKGIIDNKESIETNISELKTNIVTYFRF